MALMQSNTETEEVNGKINIKRMIIWWINAVSFVFSTTIAEPIEEIKQENFYNIKVVDEQPLLKIKSTSLLHGAIMLYEGEV